MDSRPSQEEALSEKERAALSGLLNGTLDPDAARTLRTLFDDASEYTDVRQAILAILAASEPSDPERLVQAAHAVMVMLDRHGPGIVPHLIDTDENAGQRLRDLLAEAGYPVRAARLTDTAPETDGHALNPDHIETDAALSTGDKK